MSDVGDVNYSEYYDADTDYFAPCDASNVSSFGKVFLPTLYSMVFIIGFLGNGLVVCVLVKHRNQTNLTDICLFSLALSDLLFVFTLPFYSHYAVTSVWTFGDFMCRFLSGSHTTGFFSSIFFMVVMTIERYLAIMHTHRVANYRTVRTGIILNVFVWMLSMTVSLPAFIFSKVTNESHGLSCEFAPENRDWKLYDFFSINILGLVIPLLVMIVCYSRILPTLSNLRTAKRHRVVKLIISIVIAFFLFWAPYNICLFVRFLNSREKSTFHCDQETILNLSVTVTETFAYTHCCLNPIVYAFVGQRFKKRAWQLLKKWVPGVHLLPSRDLSDSSFRKSSLMTRSYDVPSTIIN